MLLLLLFSRPSIHTVASVFSLLLLAFLCRIPFCGIWVQTQYGIWIYDFRTNIHFTLKQNPLTERDLEDFIACYHPENRFDRQETYNKDTNPDVLAADIIENLQSALDSFNELMSSLQK